MSFSFRNIFNPKKVENTRSNDSSLEVNVIGAAAASRFKEVNSETDAMKNSIVYRALSILSDSVSSIPLNIYKLDEHGHWSIDKRNNLYSLFTKKTSERLNPYEFLENLVLQLYIKGNAYIYIKRNSNYDISQLILCYPNTVSYEPFGNRYIISDNYNHVLGTFGPESVIHIRNKSINGLVGESAFRYAGRSLGLAKAADVEAGNTLSTGGKFKGLISQESALTGFSAATDKQVDTIASNLQAEIDSGKDILTLQSGAEFKSMSQSMRDLQITDIKTLSLNDIARFFGISGAKLGISTSSNYQASQQEQLNFFSDTLQPLLKKIESAFNDKLIAKSISDKYKIAFDRTKLIYFKDILANYKEMMNIGIMSINDVRKELNLPWLDGGDISTISCNIQVVPSQTQVEQTEEIKQEENNIAVPGLNSTDDERPSHSLKNKATKNE